MAAKALQKALLYPVDNPVAKASRMQRNCKGRGEAAIIGRMQNRFILRGALDLVVRQFCHRDGCHQLDIAIGHRRQQAGHSVLGDKAEWLVVAIGWLLGFMCGGRV
jgi:hypothetical protein